MVSRVSIIVINWNGRQYLQRCLDSLLAQDYPDLEIILMDNGSTDGSADYVRETYPAVTVVSSPQNLGTSRGNNMAARYAKGDYLFLLNNDAWLMTSDTISRLVGTAARHPLAAIIGCMVLNVDGSMQDIGEKIDALGFPGGLSVESGPLPEIIDDVFFVTSCAVLIRSTIFRTIGGYDNRFFWSHEEVDLAWQVRLRGLTVLVDTRAVVTHVGGGGMIGGAPGKESRYRTTTARIYHRECSTLATLLKNYSARSLIQILPVYVSVNIAEVFFFLLLQQPAVARQYLRAYWWNLCHLLGTMRARRRIQRARMVPDREIKRYFWRGIRKLRFVRVGNVPRVDRIVTGSHS